MRALEAFNKVLVGILLFLVCAQASLLFVMKNMQDQAKVRLVENQTLVPIKCGETPFSKENYWNPLARDYNGIKLCNSWDCDRSYISWLSSQTSKNLHIVSVKNAPSMNWNEQDAGGVVRVRVPASDKPQILALSSQSMHEWRLVVDKKAKLEKIIVATPTIVWMDGVPENTKIEYLSKEKMCSYPYSWEEAHNPDNEFRLFVGALKKITGLEPTSFQGASVGKDFVLPKPEDLARRQIASLSPENPASLERAYSPVYWERELDRVVAKKISAQYVAKEFAAHSQLDMQKHEPTQSTDLSPNTIVLPQKTDVVGGMFILSKFQLYVWNTLKNQYERVPVPLSLPSLSDLTAMAHDDSHAGRVFVFNEAFGGEIYSYDHSTGRWDLVKSGIPSAVRAMHYNAHEKKLYSLASRGRQFTDVLVFSEKDKKIEKKPLTQKIPFDPIRWKWEVIGSPGQLHVVLHTPLQPAGEVQKILF